MRLLEKVSIRFRFMITVTLVIVLSLVSGITFLHTINSISNISSLEKELDNCFLAIHEIDHTLAEYSIVKNDSSTESLELSVLMEAQLNDFLEKLNLIAASENFSTDTVFQHSIQTIRFYVSKLHSPPEELISSNIPGILHTSYLDPIIQQRNSILNHLYEINLIKQKKYSTDLLIVLFTSFLIIVLLFTVSSVSSERNLTDLLSFVTKLEKGERPEKLSLVTSPEYSEISDRLNSYLDRLDEKIRYLQSIGEGKPFDSYQPEKEDVLGNEIKNMADKLSLVHLEERKRQKEDNKRSWTSEGIAQFAEILRSERENVQELSFKIIQKIVTYLNVEMGTIFLTEKKDETQKLEAIATYAYDRRKFLNKSFLFGEGLPGTCAIEKEKIYINDIPEEYSDIISGVGQTKPKYVLLVPLKIEDEIFGILEIASLKNLEKFELNFIDELAESIASTLLAVKTNERTAILLKQSQEQAVELLVKEDELKVNLAKLESTQEESHRKETETTGILNAINEASLHAELNLSGRFISINKKFSELLELPDEQILGKHHREFINDNFSEEYKSLWDSLKKGDLVFRTDTFNLFSGKNIILKQTFAPILNKDGKVKKILVMAIDITQMKLLEQELYHLKKNLKTDNKSRSD